MKLRRICSIALLLILVCPRVPAQSGTQHGVSVTFTAPTPVGGDGTLAGYNIYRCAGTCIASNGTWAKIDASLDLTNGYLDQSALTTGSVYSYAVTAVDTNGNESSFSNVAVNTYQPVVNPNPPSGCNAKNQ
jgi:hypothetical protein